MSAPPLDVRREGDIAWLRLNRPEALNALDLAMARALDAALAELSAPSCGVRAVVLEGAGRAFCAGGDLPCLRAGGVAAARELIEALHAAILRLDALPMPVIAKLHGSVAGAGVSLALACDLAIASDDTRINLAYVNIGASCDGSSSWSLPRIVGLRRALEIALLGEDIDATESLRLGLVNRLVPAADLQAEAERLAERLAAGPTLALGAIKRLLRDAPQRSLPEQLAAEQAAFLHCAATNDFRGALDAFAAKEPPRFAGR
jgi:2-(1,2-epoxy-1,2-dihydrophenyl)acetyl-CoA isomerase